MDRDTNSLKNGRERGLVASNARQAEISKARWLKAACDMLLELDRQREQRHIGCGNKISPIGMA
jgi:hypothetical protein